MIGRALRLKLGMGASERGWQKWCDGCRQAGSAGHGVALKGCRVCKTLESKSYARGFSD